MTIRELIEHLKTYNPDDVIAYDLWSVEDVIEEGNHHRDYATPTREQAEEVLFRMEHHKDCNVGLNWDYMNYHLDNVMSDGGQAI